MKDISTLIELLQYRATNQGDSIGYHYLTEDAKTSPTLTYRQLHDNAGEIARALLHKCKKGDRALLLYPTGLDFISAFFGCMYAGVIPVPAYPPRKNQRLNRIKSIFEDSGVNVVLTTANISVTAKPIFEKEGLLSEIQWLESDVLESNGKEVSLPEINSEDIAFLQYTSGSTGNPKGVMVNHHNILNNVAAIQSAFRHDGPLSVVSWLPLFHDMGLIGCVLSPIYEGYPVHLMSPANFLQKPVRWLKALSETKASRSGAPNFAYDLCVDNIKDEELEGIDLSHWKVAFNGSEPVKAETLEWFSKRFAKYGFKKEAFFPCYGMAESTLFVSGGSSEAYPNLLNINRVTLQEGTIEPASEVQQGTTKVSCGTTHLGHEVLIVNPDTKARCQENESGEIWVKGDSIVQGYWNKPELSEETFRAYTSDTNEGPFLRTGDLGFLHEDELYITGRKKELLIIFGRNYHPEDIEATIADCHPALMKDNTAVIGVDVNGMEQVVVVHGVKRSEVRDLSPAPIYEAITSAVASEYGLQVHDIVLMKPTGILKTSSGKIRRQAIKQAYIEDELEMLAGLRSGTGNVQPKQVTVLPRVELEKQLLHLWREIPGMENAGLNDNFFDLGGNSFLTVQLTNKINNQLGYDLLVTDLFTHPTVSTTAQYLLSLSNDEAAEEMEASESDFSEPIAIIGLSGMFPDADNVDEYWNNIRDGVESLHHFTDEQLLETGIPQKLINRPNYVKAGSMLWGAAEFDANFFDLSPREAQITDPQQRKLLECAYTTLENAGYGFHKDRNIGVFVGVGENRYIFKHIMTNQDLIDALGELSITFANSKDYAATRLSYKLDLRGPSVNVNTACSSSLVAVHKACYSLLNNDCKMALAGASDFSQLVPEGYLYEEGAIFSPDGHCRPFDENAGGTRVGSGVGCVLLKKLSDAIADGDTIHAVVKGSALNNDGHDKIGFTSPSVNGQANVIKRALKAASLEPETISYVETHGTGTVLGDPIEIEGLKKAFNLTGRDGSCAIGSLKGNVGHLFTAAGIASILKITEALRHREIAPSINFDNQNPKINFEGSPFYVNTELKPWKSTNGEPLRAGISSFGIGGTNGHIILEEAPAPQAGNSHRNSQLILLSAKTEEALDQQKENLIEHIDRIADINLSNLAFTLQVGRTAYPFRQFWLADSIDELKDALENQLAKKAAPLASDHTEKPVVFMFPGQGSQYAGMTKGLYEEEPVFKAVMDQCATLLEPLLGEDIRKLIYPEGDDEVANEQLKQTSYTQPVLFCVEYALAHLWQSWGLKPSYMTGHSIGEYAAACLAGVFTLEDALAIVTARGKLIQSVEKGDMLSVQCPIDEVRELAEAENCSIAAINSPKHCVLSGRTEDIARLQALVEEKDLSCRLLATSHAFHSDMMDSILDDFAAELEKVTLSTPRMPFVSNVTGELITDEQATDPNYWVGHIRNTVNFAAGIDTLLSGDGKVFIEVGPGNTLNALARKNPKFSNHHFVASVRHIHDPLPDGKFMMKSLGQLWQAGVNINWERFHVGNKGCRIPLPTHPFEKQRHWIDRKPKGETSRKEKGGKSLNVSDWFYVPQWQRQPAHLLPPAEPQEEPANFVLLADEEGLGFTLAKKIREAGNNVYIIQQGSAYEEVDEYHYTIDPESEADYQYVFDELKAREIVVSKIITFWGLQHKAGPKNMAPEWFEERQKQGFDSLTYLMRAAAPTQMLDDLVQFYIVTNNLYSVSGNETIWPENAPLMSLCKIAPQEYLNTKCHQIDVSWPLGSESKERELLDEALFDEVNIVPVKTQVAFRDGQRWIPRYIPYDAEQTGHSVQQIADDNVYVITGGLGNVGLEIATYLASQASVKLVLTRRSKFPDKKEWSAILEDENGDQYLQSKIRKLRTIENSGSEVHVMSADVRNKKDMALVLDTTEEWFGTINGVVHGAGIVQESIRPIKELTIEDRNVHFDAKVYGLLILDQLLRGRELDFIMLTSSLSVVLGGPGSGVYAAANTFMDAFAKSKHHQGDTRWVSVDWDWWSSANEMNLDHAEILSSTNTISLEEGQVALQHIFGFGNLPQIVTSLDDLETRIKKWVQADTIKGKKKSNESSKSATDPNFLAPENDTQKMLAIMWQGLLGIEEIGIRDNFFELGGDSLLISRLSSLIKQEFDIGDAEFQMKRFYESPTIEEIAKLVTEAVNANKIKGNMEKLQDSEQNIEEGII